ncbi:MAG: sulfite exporter TauE/SafE family protein, partial [Deltaproteobacteria bacterium]
VGIPGGVYRYIREGRMAWPLALVIISGTLPGVFIGAVLRIKYLPDPSHFRVFVGCVLLYIGIRLLYDLISKPRSSKEKATRIEDCFKHRRGSPISVAETAEGRPIRTVRFSLTNYKFEFYGETFSFNPILVFAMTFCVGIISGTYGIGGGAIVAPFLIAIFALPVYAIAGAALLSTFLTSIVGLCFYTVIAPLYADTGLAIAPDWPLGALFGLGGLMGMYCGARVQKHFPARLIKLILGAVIVVLSLRYISNIF